MFVGVINRQLVVSCHPILVSGQRGVAAGFDSLDAAQRFLAGRGYGAGSIYRHNGRDWDKLPERPFFGLDALRESANPPG